jgi:hypothetical protein
MLKGLSGGFSEAYLLDHCYFAQNNSSDKKKIDVDGTSQKWSLTNRDKICMSIWNERNGENGD